MAINKVGSKGIEDGSVASADFAPNTVTSAKLQDGAVTNAKLTNSSVTLAGSSVSLGGSVSLNNKFVDWQSVITADGSTGTTAVSGRGYFIDTTSAVHTVTLPASASRGDFIAIKDYAGTFNTNNLTIARNGHNIQGVANDSLITTNRASLVLVYVNSTKGWLYWEEHNVASLSQPLFITATGGTVTTSGDYKIHTFTGDGCFAVSTAGNGPVVPTGGPNTVSYLVIAGGGSGGGIFYNTGGGGAGGFREGQDIPGSYTASPLVAPTGLTITATTYPITVGGGGAGAPGVPGNTANSDGSPSTFLTITSTGGGKGAGAYNGSPGGSGGGAGQLGCNTGGSGNTPPTSPPQGTAGGNTSSQGVGGGGGAGVVGTNGTPTQSGSGGNGATTSITGSPVTRAGGGGGGGTTWTVNTLNAPGGTGGGGIGAYGFTPNGVPVSSAGAGVANTGSGGGGSERTTGAGSGGKGLVVIRYKYQ